MDLTVPAIAIAAAVAFAQSGGKKKKKKKTSDSSDSTAPGYEEGGTTKPKTKPKGQPDGGGDGSGGGGGADDHLLDPSNYDGDYFDPECGPGWVVIGDDCLWPSEYDAPAVPRDGCWISPDCGVTIVGADFWDEVVIPQIEEWVLAGYGKGMTDTSDPNVDDWLNTSSRVAYEILAPYDLGPINPDTGKRDTGIRCLDFFPFFSPQFDWYIENPPPQYPDGLDPKYWPNMSAFDLQGYEADVAAWEQANDQWYAAHLEYWEEIVDQMTALAALFTDIAQATETYYYEVYSG